MVDNIGISDSGDHCQNMLQTRNIFGFFYVVDCINSVKFDRLRKLTVC